MLTEYFSGKLINNSLHKGSTQAFPLTSLTEALYCYQYNTRQLNSCILPLSARFEVTGKVLQELERECLYMQYAEGVWAGYKRVYNYFLENASPEVSYLHHFPIFSTTVVTQQCKTQSLTSFIIPTS